VLSVNGSTGTITNIARTIVDNNFIAAQTIASTSTGNATTVSPTSLTHYYDVSGFSQLWQSADANSTITFPSFTTTLAGLAGTQTFDGTKTFNALTTFNAGISSAGGTFSGDIAVNGGDITTTSTSSSLFNANATTLDILSTQSSGLTLNIANATSFSGNKIINIGRNNGGAASTILTVGSNTNDRISLSGGVTIGLVPSTITNIVGGGLNVNTLSNFNSQARFAAGISASGGITFNSNVDINSDNILTVATITNTAGVKAQLDIDNRASSRVAIGDYDGSNQSTYIFLRDNTGVLQLSSPFGDISIGDPNAIDTGNAITYVPGDAALYGNNSSLDGFSNLFVGYISATNGISASGVIVSNGITASGTVNLLGTLLINGAQGSSNQVLTSTGSGITWATPSGSGGGITRSISTITASTSAGSTANTDYVYNGNTSGNITLTMPTAASNTNRYTIKNSNTGILTVSTTSSQTIDGVTFYSLNKQYQAIDLLSDNSNWFII
jgi:hypothetical protein